jgi:N-acetylglucosaminyldiphosphoundecaprenol N-acetyl-beta-D-mannosaminyltransferase
MRENVSHAARAVLRNDGGTADVSICSISGFKVNPCTQEQLLDRVFAHSGGQQIFVSLNLHGMYLCITNRKVHAVHERQNAVRRIDGMPVVWLAKLAGLKLTRRHRTPWNYFFWPLLARAAAERQRIYYLGSTAEIFDRGIALIGRSLPDLQIGGRHGYFDSRPGTADCKAVVNAINKFSPDILLVGMGMPKQEEFIHDVADQLTVPVIMTCGAAMEVLAGVLPRPPRWISDSGLEGPFRLLYSPRRTWRRYLVEPWTVLFFVWRHYVSTLRQHHP